MKNNLLVIAFALCLDWIALFGAQHFGFIAASRWTLFLLPLYGVAVGVLIVAALLVLAFVFFTVRAVLTQPQGN